MEKRLRADLTLLYALRNKIVHEGTRILPQRMAAYLAQLGAEIILTTMQCDDFAARHRSADNSAG